MEEESAIIGNGAIVLFYGRDLVTHLKAFLIDRRDGLNRLHECDGFSFYGFDDKIIILPHRDETHVIAIERDTPEEELLAGLSEIAVAKPEVLEKLKNYMDECDLNRMHNQVLEDKLSFIKVTLDILFA